MSKKEDLMNISNARKPLQIKNMQRIAQDGVCPFCTEHLKKYHEPPILKDAKYWVVTPSMYPYDGVSQHILFITKEHISDSSNLSSEAWAELQELSKWVMNEFDIDGATLLMRSGDMSKTGGTVLHLHAQLVAGKNPDTPVVTRIA